jgi:hypothetical protein
MTDFDCSSNKIFFLELNPLAVNNCKGISTGENFAIAEIGKAAQSIVKDVLEIVGKKMGLSISDKKVGVFTGNLFRESK